MDDFEVTQKMADAGGRILEPLLEASPPLAEYIAAQVFRAMREVEGARPTACAAAAKGVCMAGVDLDAEWISIPRKIVILAAQSLVKIYHSDDPVSDGATALENAMEVLSNIYQGTVDSRFVHIHRDLIMSLAP